MLVTAFLVFITGFILPTNVRAQKFSPGRCPSHIQAMPNFNFGKYSGLWFEVEKYLFLPEITGKCIYVRYLPLQPDGVSFQADIVQIQYGTKKKLSSPSSGKIVSNDGSAKIHLMVNALVPFTNVAVAAFKYPYWILETDYNDYSIKWACEEFTLITGKVVNMQSIWILSRTRDYPAGLRKYVHDRLRSFGLQPELLLLTDQTNCPTPPNNDYLNEPIEIEPPIVLFPKPLRNITVPENQEIHDTEASMQ